MNKKLSTKTFVITSLLILIFGLSYLAGLYYILDIQYQRHGSSYSPSGGPITSAPATLKLEIDQPDDDQLVFSDFLIVSGKTAPNLEVLISGNNYDEVIKAKADGTFSTIFTLTGGVNRLGITVFDATGDQKKVFKTIYYSKEKI